VTFDPLEGIDPDGNITTGADRERIAERYLGLLDRIIDTFARHELDRASLLLYGSVATGQAVSPTSDVDLLIIHDAADRGEELVGELRDLSGWDHDLTHEVAPVLCPRGVLDSDTPDGLAMRCFVKHYCVVLAGPDPAVGIANVRVSSELAWSFNHDVRERVERYRSHLRTLDAPTDICRWSRNMAGGLLLAATSLANIVSGAWTTDRTTAANILAVRFPERSSDVHELVRVWRTGTPHRAEIDAMLDTTGMWLTAQIEASAP
jgi:hypothetical protein